MNSIVVEAVVDSVVVVTVVGARCSLVVVATVVVVGIVRWLVPSTPPFTCLLQMRLLLSYNRSFTFDGTQTFVLFLNSFWFHFLLGTIENKTPVLLIRSFGIVIVIFRSIL